jgi:hypothetical protein
MTVRCVACQLFNLQQYPGMAKEGYGRCGRDVTPPGRFESAVFPRQCRDFRPALPVDVERRITWISAQRARANAALGISAAAANPN